jgi:hypothetical protein
VQRLLLILTLASLHGESILNQGTPLDSGFRQMYNLQFDAAHRTFREWERQHPDDPMGPVSDAAAYLFSEFERLHVLEVEFFVDDSNFLTHHKLSADPAVKQGFDAALARSDQLADRILRREPQDGNAMFARVLRFGLSADYLGLVEKRNLAALSDVKKGRSLAEKLLAADPNFCDAYLAIGVENYLLSLKPAPVRWLLRVKGAQTDRELGIEKISLTAERGHYLLPYARVLLALAAIRDKNPNRAREILTELSREFPLNRLYAQQLARLRQ